RRRRGARLWRDAPRPLPRRAAAGHVVLARQRRERTARAPRPAVGSGGDPALPPRARRHVRRGAPDVSAVRRILVVNLTRFGDLLQTSPVIVGLREQHPAARITALVPRNFVDVARGLPAVDDVVPFDFDGLARLLLAGRSADIRAAYGTIET